MIARDNVQVYSFGMVMWELLVNLGYSPFSGYTKRMKNTPQIIQRIREGLRPNIPVHLQKNSEYTEIMQRCWNGDPAQRPKISAVLQQLNVLLAFDESF